MRRAVSAVLALLLLCFTLMTRADSVSDDAEALRSFLQSHYGVTILMGDTIKVVKSPYVILMKIPYVIPPTTI